ncbi:acylneuraminate cytidylyltransferase family protein [Alteromonas mediterranea]|uniref:acylneuraminate cytidylyltransferase family protein n=1 Tax=Alteromonas mediterranea TaxID=314275 RepID=UPI002FE02382
MKNYAFIFARGGSKGLPRKNIKPLAGKPLIAYSIEVAKRCPIVDAVFVSTDDKEIAEVATENGAIVINRPAELATDTSPELLAWRHAVNWVQKEHGPFSLFVSLPPTSPLRAVDDVTAAIEKIQHKAGDVCLSITPANRNPYFNMVTIAKNGRVELVIQPQSGVSRRQDAPPVFDITTVVYATTPSFILQNDSLFSGIVTAVEVPKNRAVDIDDIYDFMLAEAIIKETTKKTTG